MMSDVITISDEEDEVQFLNHIVNIEERPVVDLTTTRKRKKSPEIPKSASNAAPKTPSHHDLMFMKKEIGNKHFRSNAFNEAIRYYREAAELAKKLNNPEMSAILHFNLAMSYDKLGAYNQAADECAAAVKLNDHYIKAHVKRAEIFMSQGKYEEAVICYEHVCELDSTKKDDAMRRIQLAKEWSSKAKKHDQYEILGLKPYFSLDDLRASYKQKARAHHPDKHSDADIVTRRIQEKIFKEASEAYSFFRKRFA
jgi:tetratricopeptide (TPR) repeat protein